MYRFARGTIFSARTFLPSTSGTQPVSSNISEASSTSSAISSLVVSLTMIVASALSLCRRKLHQRERRATVWSIGIAERLCHLQMMVVRCFDNLHRFARRFDRSREVTTLALKVGGLQGPICNRDRRV